MAWIKPCTLSGERVELVPLVLDHASALAEAAGDGQLWELWYTGVPAPEQTAEYIAVAAEHLSAGRALPFAVRDRTTGDLVGTTRFCNVDAANRRLEIGYTWYAARVHRTHVNSEAKYLLLRHAFAELRAIAVEFRTHWLNRRSRAAIERLGAKQDGVLRNHRIMPDGSYRDTVVYSIIESEWPAVRAGLENALARGSSNDGPKRQQD